MRKVATVLALKLKNGGNKMIYEKPNFDIIFFETEDVITASGDYYGINFDDLM